MTEKHKHIPDFSTLQRADVSGGNEGIIDVWCNCGKSGSTRIEPEDISWDDDEAQKPSEEHPGPEPIIDCPCDAHEAMRQRYRDGEACVHDVPLQEHCEACEEGDEG